MRNPGGSIWSRKGLPARTSLFRGLRDQGPGLLRPRWQQDSGGLCERRPQRQRYRGDEAARRRTGTHEARPGSVQEVAAVSTLDLEDRSPAVSSWSSTAGCDGSCRRVTSKTSKPVRTAPVLSSTLNVNFGLNEATFCLKLDKKNPRFHVSWVL